MLATIPAIWYNVIISSDRKKLQGNSFTEKDWEIQLKVDNKKAGVQVTMIKA